MLLVLPKGVSTSRIAHRALESAAASAVLLFSQEMLATAHVLPLPATAVLAFERLCASRVKDLVGEEEVA